MRKLQSTGPAKYCILGCRGKDAFLILDILVSTYPKLADRKRIELPEYSSERVLASARTSVFVAP